MSRGTVLVCAGGTGGHLFPAEALAHALIARGWRVELATDHRVEAYGQDFPAAATHIIRSATPSVKSPLVMAKAGWSLWEGYWQARALMARIGPKVVVGFGGYPTVPPMLAAAHLGIPTIVHDANAVLGRANRLLAKRARVLATSFPDVANGGGRAIVVQTGNPVRSAVVAASAVPFMPLVDGAPLHLVVFGGSQGAQRLNEALVGAAADLTDAGVAVLHAYGPKNTSWNTTEVTAADLPGYVAVPYLERMDLAYAAADLVVCRSGAMTVAEVAAVGLPAVYVPLAHGNGEQALNARPVVAAGGGLMIDDAAFTADAVRETVLPLATDPQRLAAMAAAAAGLGHRNAAGTVAAAALRLGARR